MRRQLASASVAAALLALAAPAAACTSGGYGYAGLAGLRAAGGVAATVSLLAEPRVAAGHVAAWVGVGGFGAGPGGRDEWLQAGLAARRGTGARLYVEWKAPGRSVRLRFVSGAVRLGAAHRVVVLELPGAGSVWQVFVDGAPAGPAVVLPGSHGRLRPMALAETWSPGRACNRSTFAFRRLAVVGQAGSWTPLANAQRIRDPGQRLTALSQLGFIAGAGG